MTRLQTEIQRLYGTPSLEGNAPVRAGVLELARPADWPRLAMVQAHFWTGLAILAPGTPSLLNLARTLMKQGPAHYPAAWAFLGEASAMDHTPEVDLGFAEYHLGAPSGDLRLAQQHFLRAAMAGRFKGFFGYARASRRAGQPGRAFIADCLRVVLGPLLWLLLGEKAQYQF